MKNNFYISKLQVGKVQASHDRRQSALWPQLRVGTPEDELTLEEFLGFESLKDQQLSPE